MVPQVQNSLDALLTIATDQKDAVIYELICHECDGCVSETHVLESLNKDLALTKLVLYSVRRTGCRIGLRLRRQPGGLRRVSSVSCSGYVFRDSRLATATNIFKSKSRLK